MDFRKLPGREHLCDRVRSHTSRCESILRRAALPDDPVTFAEAAWLVLQALDDARYEIVRIVEAWDGKQ